MILTAFCVFAAPPKPSAPAKGASRAPESAKAAEPARKPDPDASRLLSILEEELQRNFQILKQKAEPAPYFISYEVTDETSGSITSSMGAAQENGPIRRRVLDTSVRVGSPKLDNYHSLDGSRPRATASAALPIEDRPEPIKLLLWRETDRSWRAAADRLIRVKTSARNVAEDAPGDYYEEKPNSAILPVTPLKFNREEWLGRLRRLSAELGNSSAVLDSNVTLGWRQVQFSLVNTEGTRLSHGRTFLRVSIIARAKASDGEDLVAIENMEASDANGLPSEARMLEAVRTIQGNLRKLLLARPADPYAGPAILSGKAAAVFFHEIFGHRIEGHRQSDRTEGQTWANSLNTKVLPEFLSVIFDPTLKTYQGTDLNGSYAFDNEGVAARRVPLIENGVLKTFLMSRTPVKGVDGSNGHGRRQPGLEPVSRQSNLIVESSNSVPDKQLRQMLIEEARKQRKPYGLYFDMVTGGYTTTRRDDLQAFTVVPLVVYKVYADGRTQDELVRGLDIVGTPLASFGKIIATGDRPDIFNGYCGAESGTVPVAAISPAILVSEIEVQRKPTPNDRPPLVPPPTVPAAGPAGTPASGGQF